DLAVDPHANEAALAQLKQLLLVLPFAASNDRRQERDLGPVLGPDDLIGDLLGRLRANRLSAVPAEGLRAARVKQAQIIVDLGDGAYRRTRVIARRSLLDRNRGTESVDRVDVGFSELLEELPRVSGEAFDVPALPFGVDRVERERGLAG